MFFNEKFSNKSSHVTPNLHSLSGKENRNVKKKKKRKVTTERYGGEARAREKAEDSPAERG